MLIWCNVESSYYVAFMVTFHFNSVHPLHSKKQFVYCLNFPGTLKPVMFGMEFQPEGAEYVSYIIVKDSFSKLMIKEQTLHIMCSSPRRKVITNTWKSLNQT